MKDAIEKGWTSPKGTYCRLFYCPERERWIVREGRYEYRFATLQDAMKERRRDILNRWHKRRYLRENPPQEDYPGQSVFLTILGNKAKRTDATLKRSVMVGRKPIPRHRFVLDLVLLYSANGGLSVEDGILRIFTRQTFYEVTKAESDYARFLIENPEFAEFSS